MSGRPADLVEGRAPDEPLFTPASGTHLRNSSFRHHAFDRARSAGLAPLTPYDLQDGLVVEHWAVRDDAALIDSVQA
jgi:hypothetical protein